MLKFNQVKLDGERVYMGKDLVKLNLIIFLNGFFGGRKRAGSPF